MTEKIRIGNGTLQKYIQKICEDVRKSGVYYKSVVGIQRGGLNLSIPLAECIGVKHRSIKVSFYDGDKKRSKPLVDLFDFNMEDKPFIIADDLIDSGETLRYLIDKYKLVRDKDFAIAVIHWNKKNENNITPDYYADEKPNGWIVYPWNYME
jgi:hypoxanthine phosphoribosyltransferase